MSLQIIRTVRVLSCGLQRLSIMSLQQFPRGFARNIARESSTSLPSRLTGKKTQLWDLYNEVIYPPYDNEISVSGGQLKEPVVPRNAEITYVKEEILYSQKKLWLLAYMIRGLSVDEAFQQLGFRSEKGARILEKALEDTIEKAVRDQDVEFCTDLWIEKALVLRGQAVPRVHKGLRTNLSADNYHYAKLLLRLREGSPPVLYHPFRIRSSWNPSPNCLADGAPGWGSADDVLDIQLRKLRRRRIPGEL